MEKSSHYVVQCIEKNKIDAGIDFMIQPTFDLSRVACIGGEVLVRGKHRRNVVPPNFFISQLEATGGILLMGDYIMVRLFEFIAEQPREIKDKQIFTLNVSQVQLNDSAFAARANGLLEQYQITPQQIIFEVTDSAEQPEQTMIDNLQQLRDAGANLAWDGIDCLDKLKRKLDTFQPDYIKLDRSCLASNNLNDTFMMLEYLDSYDCDVIVEGVENYTHISTMLHRGVKYGQGFLFSRPVSKEQFQKEYMVSV